MAKNPFVHRGPIRDSNYFYGRKEELRHVFNCLCFMHPQPCELVGDGKVGKSSFLRYIADPAVYLAEGLASEKHIFVHFDFQSHPMISRTDFWRLILKDVSRQIADPQLSQEVDRLCNLEDLGSATAVEIEELMETLGDEELKLFLLFDGFETIKDNPVLFNREFLDQLRILTSNYDLAYVVATKVEMEDLISGEFASPFPNLFTSIRLALLSDDEVRELIGQTKNPVEPSLHDEERFIVRMAGRHPYLTQLVCYHLFDLKADKSTLSEADYETVKRKSIAAARQSFFRKDLWLSFTDRERLLLRSIAWNQEVDSRMYRAELKSLESKQYIREQDGRWVIFCELLRSLIRESQGSVNGPVPSPRKERKPKLEYDDFEILIEEARPEEGYPIRVIRSPGAGEARGKSLIDLETLQVSLADILERKTNRVFLKEFGQKLLDTILVDEVRDRFYSAYRRIKHRQRGLRILLRIDPPELACLPWEFLYLDKKNRWLATSSSIAFSRYVYAPDPPRDLGVPEVQLPLNILCVLSNPSGLSDLDLPPLDLEKEFGAIKEELEDLIYRGLVTLEPLREATMQKIHEKLHRGRKEYHVLHYSGHGFFADEEEQLAFPIPLEKERGYLLLQDSDGCCYPAHEEDLAELLCDTGVRLVVLNACQTATSSSSQGFVGLATTIVQTGPPAVVAMQHKLLDKVGRHFARAFYERLADGSPVDVCVSEARGAILSVLGGREQRDWATPVLFMRLPDGVIFDIKSVDSSGFPVVTTTPGKSLVTRREKLTTRPTVFISYSHKDEEEKEQLLSHLDVLQNAGLIDRWSDDRISAGADWEAEINQAIAQAKVAILLISANFLTSEFIRQKEVPELLRRRKREGLTVFPVIAKPCPWKRVDWLANMNVRPSNGKPVWSDDGSHADEDLTAIAEEVATILRGENSIQ